MRKLIAAVVCASALMCPAADAQNPSVKPRVPPGIDPGGISVAIIGDGLDYTRPEIARRLARDGEGEIVGWDFIDEDRRPFGRCATPCDPQALAPLLREPARLIAIRASMAAPQSLVRAMQLASQVEARAVLLSLDPPAPAAFMTDAAARFPAIAIIARTSLSPGAKQPRGPNHIGVDASAAGSMALVARYAAAAVHCTQTGLPPGETLIACAERLAAP